MGTAGPQAARLFLILLVSFDVPALLLFLVASKWKHKPPPVPGIWNSQAKIHGVSPGPLAGLGRPLRVPGSPTGAGQASLADIALHRALTPAAGDVAAPVVLAVAPLDHAVCVGVVAASTAHEVAAVAALGCLVALPGGGGVVGEHSHHLQPHGPAWRPTASHPAAEDLVPCGRGLGLGGF